MTSIQGYDTLPIKSQKMFDTWYNRYCCDARDDIQKVEQEKGYLKVTFSDYWLHCKWYNKLQ